MHLVTTFAASLLLALTGTALAAAADIDDPKTKQEVDAFFDGYLAVYNRRFGHPERSTQFREELSQQVLMPFLQSPPMSTPRVPETVESFTAGFEGFVTMLEGKGVERLEWVSREFQVLSDNKVLANNVGVGFTEGGEIAYETASLYLLYRTEEGWRIVMFSPYDRDKLLRLERS
ncbi:MAG: hypothetical protein AAF184_08790 [Pseudomonadota bacterium]